MPQSLGSLAVGAKIKFGTIYGNKIQWKIADKDHTDYPSNSVTLVTDRIIKIMAHDGKEANNSDSNRKSYGNNRYKDSNIRQWLNKDSAAGTWYEAQHSADAPPTTANCANYNGYDTLPGFLNGFTAEEKAALLSTTLTVGKASVDGGGTETVTDKIFPLSGTEVGLSTDFTEGSKLALFSDNASRIAMPTADAVSNSNYTSSSLKVSAGWYYWLRTPYASNSYIVRSVNASGALGHGNAYGGNIGLRPACNLSSGLLISDSVDADGCYTVIYNEPPVAPGTITVPSGVIGGNSLVISWTAGSDPEGQALTYKLERQYNDGSWTLIYSGPSLTYTDTSNDAWDTIKYRVKAMDNVGNESEPQTSSVVTVSHNQPPTIPASITAPSSVVGGQPLYVSWGQSTDPEGQPITYKLERKIDLGAWTEVYSGTSLTFSDTSNNSWDSVRYRVKAMDDVGNESAYKTSDMITITHNQPPAISGEDGNIGDFEEDFISPEYTVNDPDIDTVTVVEKLDTTILRTYLPNSEEENTVAIDAELWRTVLNGSHVITIQATDSYGAVSTRTWDFTKSVTVAEMKLLDPLPADEMPTRAIIFVQGIFPLGSILTVKACNNAFDDEPFWEDVSAKVLSGQKINFNNQIKTADDWGVSVWLKLERGISQGPCYIQAFGGNFE
jgi:hypothetical protein